MIRVMLSAYYKRKRNEIFLNIHENLVYQRFRPRGKRKETSSPRTSIGSAYLGDHCKESLVVCSICKSSIRCGNRLFDFNYVRSTSKSDPQLLHIVSSIRERKAIKVLIACRAIVLR